MRTLKDTLPAPTLEKVNLLVGWLAEKKARHILALDLSGENGLAEAVIIVSATSARHGQGLARHLLESARREKQEYLRIEGFAAGQWILLDFNDVIVHIFQGEQRELFRLEDLWPNAPILADFLGEE